MNFTAILTSALALTGVFLFATSAVAGQPQLAYEASQTGVSSIDNPCPPGSRWEAEGYRRGKWQAAHCSAIVTDR